MALSREVLDAVDAIRRDLKVSVSVEREMGNFYEANSIRVRVTLTLADEVISESDSFAFLPDCKER